MLETIKEFIELFYTNLKVKVIQLIEYGFVVTNYYSSPTFLKIDLSLLLSYLFSNPFRMSKQFLLNRGEKDLYTYGETPLTTLDLIAQTCQLLPTDTVIELGCGRGRTCFWLSQFVGCSVIGVDFVPGFIERAQAVKSKYQIQNVEFRLEDMFKTSLAGVTVIYLYGTSLSVASIQQLADRFSHLPQGTKLITVSYRLSDYQPQSGFKTIKMFSGSFTWGMADLYLQIKQ